MIDVPLRIADGTSDMATATHLFREYQQWLGVDLCFQDFENELAALPGAYAPPNGTLLLAGTVNEAAGCIAVRPLPHVGAGNCEMKRLYVRDAWRGTGLGRRLAEASIDFARKAGYRRMVLDTLPKLTVAKAMYERMGFNEIPAYYDNPLPGVVYMDLAL